MERGRSSSASRREETTVSEWDQAAFEKALIDDMRANGGAVTSGPMAGAPIMILTTTGAKSGEPRHALLMYLRDGHDYVVAGSKGGAPTSPAWFHNLQANPKVQIEAGGRTFAATASVADEDDRAELWARLVAALPQFGEYPEKSGRVIPMIRLRPVDVA
jgi:deazaflavin-dependent oxidoreductase (nitroreductase family)